MILRNTLKWKNLKNSYQNKILIWTWTSLHISSGSPAVLYNLIKELKEYDFYYFYGCNHLHTKTEPNNLKVNKNVSILEGIDYSYRPFLQLFIDFVVRVPVLTMLSIYYNLKYKNAAIFSIFYDRCWVLSGYLTAKILRRKYIVYCHDPFSEKYLNKKGPLWSVALKIERMVLTDKNTIVFCLYESMKGLYAKYTEATVLPHIAEECKIHTGKIIESTNNKFTIGFAGSIYSNNDECIEVLLTEVKRLDNIRVKFYGNYSDELRKRLSVIFPVEFNFKKNHDELIQELQGCDLLYLPLNFKASLDMPRECLQYVLPTKSIDYLITGKKILVHSPADYEVSRFFKQWDCGIVLNSIEDGHLGKYITDIINNRFPFDLSRNNIALEQFQKEKILPIFIKHLQNENK
jgi:glycosyltransferase involved in cell wall biosynthesis